MPPAPSTVLLVKGKIGGGGEGRGVPVTHILCGLDVVC